MRSGIRHSCSWPGRSSRRRRWSCWNDLQSRLRHHLELDNREIRERVTVAVEAFEEKSVNHAHEEEGVGVPLPVTHGEGVDLSKLKNQNQNEQSFQFGFGSHNGGRASGVERAFLGGERRNRLGKFTWKLKWYFIDSSANNFICALHLEIFDTTKNAFHYYFIFGFLW